MATKFIPGLTYSGGVKALLLGALVFMVINWLIVPLLKIMFLPLNLLTVGIFGWAVNVVALYFLTVVYPQFKIVPFDFSGSNFGAVIIPPMSLNLLEVAILSSAVVGFISNFLQWLSKHE